MRPKEINLVDLLVNILLHWRMFIVWMLAGAVLFLGISFTYFRDIYQDQQAAIEKMQSQPNKLLSEEEKQNVNYVIAYETMYQSRETYLEKSPFMKIDPNHVSKAEATVLIEAETGQKSYNIEKEYEGILQSSEFIGEVAESIGVEAIGVDEMIFLNNESVTSEPIQGANNIYNINIKNVANENINTFRIAVIHNDEKQCKDMLEIVFGLLEEKQSDIENVFGSYKIAVINQTFGIVSDAQVAERQEKILADIPIMKKTLKDLKDKLTDRELQYYNLQTGLGEITNVITPPAVYSLKDGAKYILFGIITAVFLYTFILIFIYILNNKVRATDDLRKLYNIPQLGVILGEKEKQKLFDFIDKWILSLYNHNRRRLSREEAMEYTVASIKISARKEMMNEVYFVGCRLDESALNMCEKIGQRLGEENLQTIMLNNILYDAQTLNKLGDVEGVILAVYAGSTRYDEIVEELELIRRQGIKVLGACMLA